jgi:hypothetical protein
VAEFTAIELHLDGVAQLLFRKRPVFAVGGVCSARVM